VDIGESSALEWCLLALKQCPQTPFSHYLRISFAGRSCGLTLMALDRTIEGLKLLKTAVKPIPILGSNLEGVVDLIQQSCEIAKVRASLPSHH
jgi:hypothetical protein